MCGQSTKIYFLTLFYIKFESENYFQGLLIPLQKKKKKKTHSRVCRVFNAIWKEIDSAQSC